VPPEDKAKFDELAKTLQEQLSSIKVYKIGDEAQKQTYIVGKTAGGKWAGLKATVVET
jgi:Nuclease A inhibitor-like protein